MEEEDVKTQDRRRLTRALWWSTGAAALVLVVVIVAGRVTTHDSGGEANVSSAATSQVAVTFDDHGLHAAPASTNAGIIQFSFADRRVKPTGSEVLLYYEVEPDQGGDLITGVGGSVRVLLCPHTWSLAVRVDGVVKARTPLTVAGTSSDCAKPTG